MGLGTKILDARVYPFDLAHQGVVGCVWHWFVRPRTMAIERRANVLSVNGCIGTGLWVLAHECGHQSCSPSKTINDTVGFICHSVLLVPYFSWKISHGKHHKATGNIERDMVFVPSTREQYAAKWKLMAHELSELVEDTPVKTATDLVLQQLFGWPIYLLNNVTGHNFHERQPEGRGIGKKNGWFGGVNHFFPSSPLYEAKDAKLILASDVGLGVVATGLYWIGRTSGWSNLFLWYGQVYLHVNFWLGKPPSQNRIVHC